jgi:hypothetical protein
MNEKQIVAIFRPFNILDMLIFDAIELIFLYQLSLYYSILILFNYLYGIIISKIFFINIKARGVFFCDKN